MSIIFVDETKVLRTLWAFETSSGLVAVGPVRVNMKISLSNGCGLPSFVPASVSRLKMFSGSSLPRGFSSRLVLENLEVDRLIPMLFCPQLVIYLESGSVIEWRSGSFANRYRWSLYYYDSNAKR